MTVRNYTAEDFQTVDAWARARGSALVPGLLSPVGFIVEDDQGPAGVCWVYLMFDVPVAVIDNLYTRPGLKVGQLRPIWGMLWRCVLGYLERLKDCDGQPLRYNVIRTFAIEPLARLAETEGWFRAGKAHQQITYFINHG